jgi:hypothetical protein
VEPIDPSKGNEQSDQFQKEGDALVAIDAEWRKHFASQAKPILRQDPKSPTQQTFQE